MIPPKTFTATGCLLGRRGESEIPWDKLENLSTQPCRRRGWDWLTLTSKDPLLKELPSLSDLFHYSFLLRTHKEHIVLLGQENSIVELLIDRYHLRPRLYCPSVAVESLVKSLVENPGPYVLSAVYARVEGYGQALRSVVLYGADLGSARLFRDMLKDLQPYRVGLRRHATGQEILSIGSRGEMNFIFNGVGSLEQIDRTLGFLATESFIDWTRRLAVHLR